MAVNPQARAFDEGPPPRALWKKLLIIFAILGGLSLLIFGASYLSSRQPPEAKFNTDTGGVSQSFSRPEPAASPHPMPAVTPSQMVQNAMPTNPARQDVAVNIDASSYGGKNSGGGGSSGRRGTGGLGGQNDDVEDELSNRLRESHVGGAGVAYMMPHPENTIPPGAKIPCEMQTAIDSQLPGFVTCLTQAPAMSADGRVELMPRGTWVFGEVQHGLTEGQDRLFLLWTLARTPENVMVPLDSPAADSLGESGIGGEVNNYWLRRFGLALVASIIESGPQLATAALQNNGNNSAISNYTQVFQQPSQLANTIINKEISIPPTLTVHQGAIVMLFIARPLYFGNVYDLMMVNP